MGLRSLCLGAGYRQVQRHHRGLRGGLPAAQCGRDREEPPQWPGRAADGDATRRNGPWARATNVISRDAIDAPLNSTLSRIILINVLLLFIALNINKVTGSQ